MSNPPRNIPSQANFSAASLLNPKGARAIVNGGDPSSSAPFSPLNSFPSLHVLHEDYMADQERDDCSLQASAASTERAASHMLSERSESSVFVTTSQPAVPSSHSTSPDSVVASYVPPEHSSMHDMYPDSQEDDAFDFTSEMAAHMLSSTEQDAYNGPPVVGRSKRASPSPSHHKNPTCSPSVQAGQNVAPANQLQAPLQPTFVFTNGTDDAEDSCEAAEEGVGQTNMLERTHGILHREAQRPAKKLKTEHSTDADETRDIADQGGVVGQWLKERRNEAQDASSLVAAQAQDIQAGMTNCQSTLSGTQMTGGKDVVDLTADEVQPADEDREVCYGKVDGAQAYAHTIPHPKDHNGMTSDGKVWKVLSCSVFREPLRHTIIHLRDPHSKSFATVDTRVARALAPLLDTKFLKLRVEARLDPRKRKPTDHIGKEVSEYWKLTLNLYGPKKHVTTIGKALSQKNVFLATPYGVRYGTEVMNPHAADRAALSKAKWAQQASARGGGGTGHVVRTNEEVAQDINGIFNSLSNSDELEPLEPNRLVVTELLDHQKRALRFMTNRETARETRDGKDVIPGNPLWRMRIHGNGRRTYYNVITSNEQPYVPDPVLGGILADQMGLGKTLQAIAFICSTLDEAKKWAQDCKDKTDEQGLKLDHVKTTLLICPKNVCSEWQDQINLHLKKNALKHYFYHGSDRCRDVKVLSEYDVVITTYSIVANELRRATNRGSSIFATTRWFRIVLDEAHVIREQSTQQSKAICSLAASRRWALTGTPVQNRLEDLGALIKFLRIKPFDDPTAFVQYIMTSFKLKDQTALQKLRLLVDSFTLRRLKDKIALPPRHEVTEELEFSPDEAALHNWFTKDAGNKMRLMQSKKRTMAGRSYQNVLRSILCLRLVSVHGRELLHEDDLQMIQGISSEQPIDLESVEEAQPVLTARAAYEMLMLMDSAGRQVCMRCSKAVRPRDDEEDKAAAFGAMLPCYDLVCNDCVGAVKAAAATTGRDERFKCPFCETWQREAFFTLTLAGVEEAEAEREQAKLNPRAAKILGRYRGPHTKTMALLRHLQQDADDSVGLPADELPIKSVVFTEWTSHMDLIEIALEDRAPGIRAVRFDGKMSVRQQRQALDTFRTDPAVNVIIVSIRAGGVGLNLTAASRVYVMEPQWNPAAEAQAVDRVHRLGQKREVIITRFIMSQSIETTMLKLQGKKKRLAEISLNKNVGRGQVAAENMEEFRELFGKRL